MKLIAQKVKIVISVILCFVLTGVLIIQPVYADSTIGISPLTTNTFNFFNQNGIYYYNPFGDLFGNSSCVTGTNAGYDGTPVIKGDIYDQMEKNRPFYENSARKYGFDWRIIAAIHYREATFSRIGGNGGSYQISGKVYPSVVTDEGFQQQTDDVADFLVNHKGVLGATSDLALKKVFFDYNGASDKYVQKALAMGFSQAEANAGEGSQYVMNKADERRDPSSPNMDSHWPGMFVDNGVWSNTATSTQYGAYVVYLSIGGNPGSATGISLVNCYTPLPGGGRLPSGSSGMTLDQAKAFMEIYKNAVRGQSFETLRDLYGMTWNDCTGGVAYNCVSFTKYFINVYRDGFKISDRIGNGNQVYEKLTGNYPLMFLDGGTTPRLYSVFSTGFSDKFGHTGVILGLDTTRGMGVIGQAACNDGESGVRAVEIPISTLTSGAYKFAWTMNVRLAE